MLKMTSGKRNLLLKGVGNCDFFDQNFTKMGLPVTTAHFRLANCQNKHEACAIADRVKEMGAAYIYNGTVAD
jgi:hypothetical protein